MEKIRLDRWMVENGFAETGEKARALIMAGDVFVDGARADKAGRTVAAGAHVEVRGRLRYVSRGGLKLEAALRHFAIDPAGLICADIGTSTGGFTDCLLQNGAVKVHAVDTGAGQIDWRLRTDPRLILHENFNARNLELADLGEPVDLAVCDVSFISATLVLPAIARVLKPDTGRMVILVKPQFEAGRGQVGKGGIVRDPELHQAACDKVRACVEELNFAVEITESPITGAEGNREFLLYGHR
ncbi:MAG TPA: TlyA family RNA methyltransferase [Bryobacteraceae bacterium]|nr:TlyA family RNA methyltransferase [Bryobacteraceae bacterium]